MSELEQELEDVAAEAGAEAAAVTAAVVAEHAAEEAARDGAEQAVEEVRDVAHDAEQAIERLEDNAQWERMRGLLLEQENRLLAAIAPLSTALQALTLNSASPSIPAPATNPEAVEAADELVDAAEQLVDAADEGTTGEATFDPLAVESAAPASPGRRRVRGVRRRG